MLIFALILYYACSFYTLLLVLRAFIGMATILSYRWQPRGLLLVIANVIFALTDPPLRFLRRFIPPLRLGNVSLDTGFLVLFMAIQFLQRAILLLL